MQSQVVAVDFATSESSMKVKKRWRQERTFRSNQMTLFRCGIRNRHHNRRVLLRGNGSPGSA